MPVCLNHHFEDPADEVLGNSLMEKIAHAVHEDETRLRPPKWQRNKIGVQRNLKTILVATVAHRLKTSREPLSVTMLAARTHLRAASHGIPSGIRPLDGRLVAHGRF